MASTSSPAELQLHPLYIPNSSSKSPYPEPYRGHSRPSQPYYQSNSVDPPKQRPSYTFSGPSLPPISTLPLSPQSPDFPSFPVLYLPTHSENNHSHRQNSTDSNSSLGSSSSALPILSVDDRRERNKAASAKYRAKKHCQNSEMRQQIDILQDCNNVLSRQLEESRSENSALNCLVEKLRGRLVAQKVLKRLREVGRVRRGEESSGGSSLARGKRMAAEAFEDTEDENGDESDKEGGAKSAPTRFSRKQRRQNSE